MKKLIITSTVLFLFVISLQAQVKIKMQQEGGVYTTPCTVNGLKLQFIFDTGASNVSISLSEAIFMLKNGYLNEADLHGSSYSQLANGEIVKNTTVNIRELEVGGIKLENIQAIIIHELSAPLLLGQSAIQKLGKIYIEGNELVIVNFNKPNSKNACLEAKVLQDSAFSYIFSPELPIQLIANTLQKAYDLCPDSLMCFSIFQMGLAYFRLEENDLGYKYFEKYVDCFSEEKGDYYVYKIEAYMELGFSCLEQKLYNESIIYFEKAIMEGASDKEAAEIYVNIAMAYAYLGKKSLAVSNSFKAERIIFRVKNISENDVINGKIKDYDLGLLYFNLANYYYELNDNSNYRRYIKTSALCNYDAAIEHCKTRDIK